MGWFDDLFNEFGDEAIEGVLGWFGSGSDSGGGNDTGNDKFLGDYFNKYGGGIDDSSVGGQIDWLSQFNR